METVTKKSLILTLADLDNNPRPKRLMDFLAKNLHNIDVMCSDTSALARVKIQITIKYNNKRSDLIRRAFVGFLDNLTKGFFINEKRIIKILESKYKFDLTKIEDEQYDFIWVEDLDLLPFAINLSGSSKIIFDAREYYPEQKKDLFFKVSEKIYVNFILNRYLKKCFSVFTVSHGISSLYEKNFGVKSTVLLSAPYYSKQNNRNSLNKIKLVYHGSVSALRGVESLVKMMTFLEDKFELFIYPIGSNKELGKLNSKCRKYKSIHIMNPVRGELVVQEMSKYDVGIMFFRPSVLNLLYCLPNKFFQNIHSGLALVIGPSPDMSYYINKFNNGVIVKDFKVKSLVDTINQISYEDIEKFKKNSLLAAENLNYEIESKKIQKLIKG